MTFGDQIESELASQWKCPAIVWLSQQLPKHLTTINVIHIYPDLHLSGQVTNWIVEIGGKRGPRILINVNFALTNIQAYPAALVIKRVGDSTEVKADTQKWFKKPFIVFRAGLYAVIVQAGATNDMVDYE
ncbi:hypothetical protein GGI19_005387 [Coemansia pectinata]|uniref:Uncharacterized protein n=1 Tax=Coemansia pectinata TaxID=1052879 RepID=A0A9W8L9D4_9FUNG|nr:hypothetical protein GGI19_005387 [Coemansia pectinata]